MLIGSGRQSASLYCFLFYLVSGRKLIRSILDTHTVDLSGDRQIGAAGKIDWIVQ